MEHPEWANYCCTDVYYTQIVQSNIPAARWPWTTTREHAQRKQTVVLSQFNLQSLWQSVFSLPSCKASVRIRISTHGLLNFFLPLLPYLPMALISITYVVFGKSSFIVYMCIFPMMRLSVTRMFLNLLRWLSYLRLHDNLYTSTGSPVTWKCQRQ